MELFLKAARLDIMHVPYRGAAPALTDTVGGALPLTIGSVAAVMPHVASGRLRPLAVSTAQRWPALPSVPTMAEAGYPDAVFVTWNGIFAPAKTPANVRERLNGEIREVLQDPAVREKLATLGTESAAGSVAEFEAFLKDDNRVSRGLAQSLNLKVD